MNCFNLQGEEPICPCLDDELYNTLSSSPLAQSLTEFHIDTIDIDGSTCNTPLHNFEVVVEKNKSRRRKNTRAQKEERF